MAAWWRRRNGSSSNPEEEWQRISTEVKASRDARLAALQGEEALVQDLTATLFHLDPIGLNFETNTDEYEAEAQTIALRLPSVSNLDEVREMVHEEFVRWFGAMSQAIRPGTSPRLKPSWLPGTGTIHSMCLQRSA